MSLAIEVGRRDCRTIPVTEEAWRPAFDQARTDKLNRGVAGSGSSGAHDLEAIR